MLDPLDWVHQWDDYEMVMYVQTGSAEDNDGIYMQVSRRVRCDGAEEWEVLYERLIGELDPTIDAEFGTPLWEEKTLRNFLHQHPQLVNEEKSYLQTFLHSNADGSEA